MKTNFKVVLILPKKPNWASKGNKKVTIRTNGKNGEESDQLMVEKLSGLCTGDLRDRLHVPAGLVWEILRNREQILKQYREARDQKNLYRQILQEIRDGKGCEIKAIEGEEGDVETVTILHTQMRKRIAEAIGA